MNAMQCYDVKRNFNHNVKSAIGEYIKKYYEMAEILDFETLCFYTDFQAVLVFGLVLYFLFILLWPYCANLSM